MRLIIVGLLAVVSLLAFAFYPRGGEPDVSRNIRQAQAQATPADAQHIDETPVTATPFLVTTAWEFTTRMSWEEYIAWMQARLPGFAQHDAAASRTYVRSSPGDNVSVTVEQLPSESGLRVRVSWQGAPS